MDIVARPWKRWGKDRTYLNGTDESRLGFYDHASGELIVEVEAARPDLEAWVESTNVGRPTADATDVTVLEPLPGPFTSPPAAPEPVGVPSMTSGPSEVPHHYGVPGSLALAKAATLPAELAEPWLMGAAGEQAVAATLAELPATWSCLHSIPLGDPDSPNGDLDHLVIGPGGVFVLNAKHHPGQAVFVKGDMVLVARHAQPYIAAARRDAMTVAVRLSAAIGTPVTVTPVIVFVGADEVVIKFPPRDTVLTTRGQLLDTLTRRKVSLSAQTAALIADVAGRPETWR